MRDICRRIALTTLLFAFACGSSPGQVAEPGADAGAEPADRRVTNLRAFARLYGYVRYFHPSDEAAGIDWNAFAVHGAGQVVDAKDAADLRDRLERLFAPIAPTVQVLLDDGTSRPLFEPDQAETSGFEIVAWQHLGHGTGPGGIYTSERTHRGDSAGSLFPMYPQPGETKEADIGGGVRCVVPLALWSKEGHTLGEVRLPLEPLVRELARTDTTDATSSSVRAGAVTVAWNVFQHFYPYFDVVDTDWDRTLTDSLDRALAPGNTESLRDLLRLLLVGLQDGHAAVYATGKRNQRGFLPWRLALADGELLVVASADDSLLRGDRVLRLDGQDAMARFEHDLSRRSGSDRWRRAIVLESLGHGEMDSMAEIELKRDGAAVTVRLPRRKYAYLPEFDRPDVEELENGIWYVNLDRASWGKIRKRLSAIAAAPGVIFDLRSYPNKNDELIAHLLPHSDDDKWMFVPRIIYPDRARLVGWNAFGWDIQPAKPHIRGKVVFITSGRAISYAESWMGFVEAYELGEIVGEATAGANGNVVPFNVPGGLTISWTGMKVLKHDGSQQHLIGITPTVPVERTAAGIRAGRDEYLERALELFEPAPRR